MTNSNFTYITSNNSAHKGMANFDIEAIFQHISEDEDHKRDIIVHPSLLEVSSKTGNLVVRNVLGNEEFQLNAWSKGQWCGKLNGLTPKYWDSCPAHLKAANGNYWIDQMVKGIHDKVSNLKGASEEQKQDLVNEKGALRFRVRDAGVDSENNQLGKTIRGIMSEKYTKFDDIRLMEMLMTILEDKELDFQDMKIAKYHRDDQGFHLKLLINEPIEIGTRKNDQGNTRKDIHYRGILIENSEVGKKSIRIKPFIWRQVCTNGLVAYRFDSDAVFKQRHIGIGEDGMRDAVAAAMGQALDASKEVVEMLQKVKEQPKMKLVDANEIIQRHSKEMKYDKKFVDMVKAHYAEMEIQNGFGIVQAFTRMVQEFGPYKDVDNRVRVETDAVKLLERLARQAA